MTTTTTTGLVPGHLDVTRVAVASFLARDRELPRVSGGELEMYVRYLESRG